MKKITLGIFIILAFAFNTRASHLMGGEIVVKVDSSNNAFFTLTLYRDGNPGSAGLGQTTSLQLSQTGITIPNVTLQRTSQTTLASSYLTEKHVYTSSMMLPNNGQYTASFSLCCRNGAIMNGPANSGFYLSTDFSSYNIQNSHTPVFLNDPMVTFPLDTVWNYNPLPYDADGDSLYWKLDTPMSASATNISAYTTPPGNANGPLTMDSQTGQITWSPSQVGNYAISILVEEYRNGVQIGEIRRDMQLIVVPDTASMNLVTPSAPQTNVTTGQTVNLSFQVQGPNQQAAIGLSAIGDPFEIPGSNANFSVSGTGTSTLTGNFTWTPTATDGRTEPYRIVVRATDGKFSYDYTILLTVTKSKVGLNDLANQIGFSVYPNPGNGLFTVELPGADEQSYLLEVFDMQGNLVKRINVRGSDLAKQIKLNVESGKGTYILRLNSMNEQTKTLIVK